MSWGVFATAVLPGAQLAAEHDLSVAPLKVEIAPSERVGARRAGVLCLPAGKTRWRDVDPSPTVATRGIVAALSRSGFDLYVPSESVLDEGLPATRYRIVATITAASVSLCHLTTGVAKAVLGSRPVKVSGSVTVRWRAYALADRLLVASADIATAIDTKAPYASPSRAVVVALAESAVRFAVSLDRIGVATARPRPGS